jgi:hypothetical protein
MLDVAATTGGDLEARLDDRVDPLPLLRGQEALALLHGEVLRMPWAGLRMSDELPVLDDPGEEAARSRRPCCSPRQGGFFMAACSS